MYGEGVNIRAAREIRNCVYCGVAHDIQRDHVIPTSYLRQKRRYEGDWLVPACGECNRTLGAELIFNVPDRAFWVLQAYKRKYQKLLRAIPWDDEELEDIGPSLRSSILQQESARRAVNDRLDHLHVVSIQPITYLAPLRPTIDPDDEDAPEFIDRDMLYARQEKRTDMMQRLKRRFKAKEMD
jgi:hypothetical protein